ncbi:CLUMA_CG021670, isoform A [Clunio marinus]|uniref:CLUMA_CG021670, isoform A n=1 Tax=Clunio marinus TaxID=568069 RepID=A0A1J1J7L9_9DIPT|nr:CLUMA_CG021670, isoform A [Clunio marinus]
MLKNEQKVSFKNEGKEKEASAAKNRLKIHCTQQAGTEENIKFKIYLSTHSRKCGPECVDMSNNV